MGLLFVLFSSSYYNESSATTLFDRVEEGQNASE